MIVGCLQVEIYIPGAASLKEKRSVVKSLIRRCQNKFNASVVELNAKDVWRRAVIGVAICGDSREQIERKLQFVLNFIETDVNCEVIAVHTELR